MSRYYCSVCNKRVSPPAHILKCDCCLNYIHLNCTDLNKDEYCSMLNISSAWSCIVCNEQNFPFNGILDDYEFECSLPKNDLDFINLRAISESAFVPFEFNDEPMYLPGSDLDPDLNYFNQFSATLNSG